MEEWQRHGGSIHWAFTRSEIGHWPKICADAIDRLVWYCSGIDRLVVQLLIYDAMHNKDKLQFLSVMPTQPQGFLLISFFFLLNVQHLSLNQDDRHSTFLTLLSTTPSKKWEQDVATLLSIANQTSQLWRKTTYPSPLMYNILHTAGEGERKTQSVNCYQHQYYYLYLHVDISYNILADIISDEDFGSGGWVWKLTLVRGGNSRYQTFALLSNSRFFIDCQTLRLRRSTWSGGPVLSCLVLK